MATVTLESIAFALVLLARLAHLRVITATHDTLADFVGVAFVVDFERVFTTGRAEHDGGRLGDRLVTLTDTFLELASSVLIARAHNREMIVFVFRDLLLGSARAVLDSRQLLRLVTATFAFLGIAIEMQPLTARERRHDRYAAKTALVAVASAQERSALAMFADDTVGGEG